MFQHIERIPINSHVKWLKQKKITKNKKKIKNYVDYICLEGNRLNTNTHTHPYAYNTSTRNYQIHIYTRLTQNFLFIQNYSKIFFL